MSNDHIHVDEYSNYCESCIGATIQVIVFILNAVIYIASLLAIAVGLYIGGTTDTIRVSGFKWDDIYIFTPASFFLVYGIFLSLVTLVGCFASSSANRWIVLVYIGCIIWMIIYDSVWGIRYFTNMKSLKVYHKNWNDSKKDYGKQGVRHHIGMFPVTPKYFWDHLQIRGSCCGFESPKTWESTPLYNESPPTYPDSCCNKHYYTSGCGKAVWKHPDKPNHTALNMLHNRGCLSVFPKPFIDVYMNTSWVGIIIFVLLLLCILGALTIFIMVCTKMYQPSRGPGDKIFRKSSGYLRALNDKEMQKDGKPVTTKRWKRAKKDHKKGKSDEKVEEPKPKPKEEKSKTSHTKTKTKRKKSKKGLKGGGSGPGSGGSLVPIFHHLKFNTSPSSNYDPNMRNAMGSSQVPRDRPRHLQGQKQGQGGPTKIHHEQESVLKNVWRKRNNRIGSEPKSVNFNPEPKFI